MMDFSVETTGSIESNTTLLHWILPGLYSPNETTTLTSHQGEIAPYFPPGPPPGQTHTYGIFLYNEPTNFAVPANYIPFFNNLTTSVLNRVGFNLTNFVTEAGLGAPVAADWFLVSTQNTGASSTVVTRSVPSATVSATTGISVMKTNTAAGTGSASLTSSSPLATQSSSGAMIMGMKTMLVVVGALGFAVNLL
jgi:Phosphatidylethanolamine-binding protein